MDMHFIQRKNYLFKKKKLPGVTIGGAESTQKTRGSSSFLSMDEWVKGVANKQKNTGNFSKQIEKYFVDYDANKEVNFKGSFLSQIAFGGRNRTDVEFAWKTLVPFGWMMKKNGFSRMPCCWSLKTKKKTR